ncbi:hypothetical protein [Parachitinimonas caeni]|uniref:Uncharacterized protein n=1 Tax=Parachitinimonas caeni TaxID=3031301 RepID=A0ABT7DVX1_9NEIS|nr:hypothetical protein [Parachitinimonas caeni]MDK2124206.1 hypothetical protein [Parachitinimonas caeni]
MMTTKQYLILDEPGAEDDVSCIIDANSPEEAFDHFVKSVYLKDTLLTSYLLSGREDGLGAVLYSDKNGPFLNEVRRLRVKRDYAEQQFQKNVKEYFGDEAVAEQFIKLCDDPEAHAGKTAIELLPESALSLIARNFYDDLPIIELSAIPKL